MERIARKLAQKELLWALSGSRHLVSSRWKAGCHTFILREVASLKHLLVTAPGSSTTLDSPFNFFFFLPLSHSLLMLDHQTEISICIHSLPLLFFPMLFPPSCNQMVSPEVSQLEFQDPETLYGPQKMRLKGREKPNLLFKDLWGKWREGAKQTRGPECMDMKVLGPERKTLNSGDSHSEFYFLKLWQWGGGGGGSASGWLSGLSICFQLRSWSQCPGIEPCIRIKSLLSRESASPSQSAPWPSCALSPSLSNK